MLWGSPVRNFLVQIAFFTCVLVAAGRSIADESAKPALTGSESTCAILMGGGGMVFANDEQNNKWFMVNRAVSQAVAGSLQSMGYRIDPLIADVRDHDQRIKMLGAEVAREKCNRVIQITHALSGKSQAMPGVAKDFEFDVAVLGVNPDGKLTGMFQKTYSYPLTREVLASLSMSEVGRTIATDIDQARVINKAPEVINRGEK